MKIIFFGTPHFVVPVLEILNKKYDLAAVVSAPDKKVGRKQLLTPSPVKQFALDHNIPVLQMENGKWPMENAHADLFVVAAYGKIISKQILDLPQHGSINIHPSALPKYRGPSPITATILNGDKTSAISYMLLDEQMDHGPLLRMIPYDVPDDATRKSLTREMFVTGAKFLPEVIDDYVAGKITPQPQDDSQATYTKIITKQDGFIDISKLETLNELEMRNLKLEIARKIRAYYPWPGVWTRLQMANGKWQMAKFLPEGKIQMEGGKPMPIKDFLNGYPEMKQIMETLRLTS